MGAPQSATQRSNLPVRYIDDLIAEPQPDLRAGSQLQKGPDMRTHARILTMAWTATLCTGGLLARPSSGNGDGLQESALLLAEKPGAGDWFGQEVAVSGDTLVIGTIQEDGGSGGVNGDPTDNTKSNSGAAYVFTMSGGAWIQEAYLKAPSPDGFDHFARAIAIDGDTIVVGAPEEDGGSSGINGDPNDNSLIDSGAAYVFVRSGTTWTQEAYLKAGVAESAAMFGSAVGISGDTIAIGAQWEGAMLGDNTGAVYVFTRRGTTWSQEARVQGSGLSLSDQFGERLALDGDTFVVGVPRRSGPLGQASAGAGYVFVRNGTAWTEEAVLQAHNLNPNDRLGTAVALQGDTLVLSTPLEDSAATTVNGDGLDNSALDAGAAYVFHRVGTSWSQEAYLKAPNAEAGDYFGSSVAVADGVVLVSAKFESSAANTINGDMNDNSKNHSGAAYTFGWTGSGWAFRDYLKASNSGNSDTFGDSAALSDGWALVGAKGVDGGLASIGAAVLFDDLQAPAIACNAKTNSEGCLPMMATCGSTSLSAPESLILQASLVNVGKNGLLFYGHSGPAAIPFQGGTLCVLPPLRRTTIQNSGGLSFIPCDGTFSFDFGAWALGGEDPLLAAGSAISAQYWFRDPDDSEGTGLTDSVQFLLIE